MTHTLIRSGTVLLVNDDVNARIIERTLLEGRGLPVRTVGNGYTACDVLARDGFRVAVIVLNLEIDAEGMNGWQLLRRLRDRLEQAPLPILSRTVVTTLRQDPDTAHHATLLGADAVLQRPVTPRDFIDTVERLRQFAPAALAQPLHPAVAAGCSVSPNQQ